MSLKPCRECGKEVSTGAKACPHCGVGHPTVSNNDRAIAFIVLAVGGLALFVYLTGSGATSENGNSSQQRSSNGQAVAPNSPAVDDTACLGNLQCVGDKFIIPASANCQQLLDDEAKSISKWDYKIGESSFFPIFSQFRWADQNKRQIVYMGDQAKFQNGFGAWQRASYECTFDVSTQKPLEAHFVDGQ